MKNLNTHRRCLFFIHMNANMESFLCLRSSRQLEVQLSWHWGNPPQPRQPCTQAAIPTYIGKDVVASWAPVVKNEDPQDAKSRNFQPDLPFVFLKGERFIHAAEKPEYLFVYKRTLSEGEHHFRLCQLLCYLEVTRTSGKDVGEVSSVLHSILLYTECSRIKCHPWLLQVISMWIIYQVISL